MSFWPLVAVVVLFSAVALLACSGDDGAPGAQSPTPASSPTETTSARGPITPSTPEPTQTGPARLQSRLNASCRITGTGAQITVEYSVAAMGSTLLSRVRLLENGQEVEDSGPLQQIEYRRVDTFDAQPGDRRTYRLVAEAPGAGGSNVQSTVQCGSSPTVTPGPRA